MPLPLQSETGTEHTEVIIETMGVHSLISSNTVSQEEEKQTKMHHTYYALNEGCALSVVHSVCESSRSASSQTVL
jgi:tartrate dehydratase beta subunit/fumarate hydratase class I family protein